MINFDCLCLFSLGSDFLAAPDLRLQLPEWQISIDACVSEKEMGGAGVLKAQRASQLRTPQTWSHCRTFNCEENKKVLFFFREFEDISAPNGMSWWLICPSGFNADSCHCSPEPPPHLHFVRMTTPPSKQQQQPTVSDEDCVELQKVVGRASAGRYWPVYFTSGLAEVCIGVDGLLLFTSAVNKGSVCGVVGGGWWKWWRDWQILDSIQKTRAKTRAPQSIISLPSTVCLLFAANPSSITPVSPPRRAACLQCDVYLEPALLKVWASSAAQAQPAASAHPRRQKKKNTGLSSGSVPKPQLDSPSRKKAGSKSTGSLRRLSTISEQEADKLDGSPAGSAWTASSFPNKLRSSSSCFSSEESLQSEPGGTHGPSRGRGSWSCGIARVRADSHWKRLWCVCTVALAELGNWAVPSRVFFFVFFSPGWWRHQFFRGFARLHDN